ncbi:hypothetical protein J1N35_037436 [Gossypium stocksii]|uniref:Uncharacterized protein n=1 Tax=Gossypium stocksii TaxID=47602 RepID=A0A9D3ZLS4_9ROSI|nr:hypothetical protein J1N35_037436 [Gossypium stocksii]
MEQNVGRFFYLHPDDVFPKVVKEFYAHLNSPKNAFIYVRGSLVLFDTNSINTQYGLSDGLDENIYLVKTITTEKLKHMLTDVCVKSTKWTVSRNDCYTIDRKVNVPLQVNEDRIPNKGAITKHIALKFSNELLPRHSNPSPTSSPPKPNDVALSTFKNAFEQQVVETLQSYVKRRAKAIKKPLQKNFTHLMPAFPVFPKELLLQPEEEDGEGEEVTAEKQTIEQEEEATKTESVHVDFKKEDDDVTQATALAGTATTTTPRSKAPMTTKNVQFINWLMNSRNQILMMMMRCLLISLKGSVTRQLLEKQSKLIVVKLRGNSVTNVQ